MSEKAVSVKTAIAVFLISFYCTTGMAASQTTHPSPHPSQTLSSFAKKAATCPSLNKNLVKHELKQAHYLPDVITKMNRPYEGKPFDVYSAHFVDTLRIKAGVQFWQHHAKALALAEKKYHVDPSIIIAILGVETFYGKQEGTYSVLSALYTLAFYYPSRQHFFSHELIEFLAMCQHQHISPYHVLGSYAGAFGMPQFMPSSYRAYGVDARHNHHIDLMHDTDDVIMSVANYMAKAGWQHHTPVAVPLHAHHYVPSQWISDNGEPLTTAGAIQQAGFKLPASTNPKQAVSILALPTHHQPEYWVAFPNLQSVLHYNGSVNYAVTVGQLAKAIQTSYDQQQSTKKS